MCVLKLSVAPYIAEPYRFIETGINVFSFEELLFHCYHYWKESLNDLENGSVSRWVKESLGLAFIGAQIDKLLAMDVPVSEKYLKFLSMEGYFDEEDLYDLEYKIVAWESKSEFEKLKQQADERLNEADYEKAAFYYEKLLSFGESAAVHNNVACCLMKLGRLDDAERSLTIALTFDKRSSAVKLNLARLYLLQNKEGAAEQLLLELEKTSNDRNVQFFLGDLELRRNNLKAAESYFRKSAEMGNTLDAYSALCRIALKVGDFKAAMAYAEKMPDKMSGQYLENIAQINYALGNKRDAIINAEQLLVKYYSKASYWAFAAKLYRETGDLEKAAAAIEKAEEIDRFCEEVIFEKARIKKALGKTLEYQSLLKRIVEKWREEYKFSS